MVLGPWYEYYQFYPATERPDSTYTVYFILTNVIILIYALQNITTTKCHKSGASKVGAQNAGCRRRRSETKSELVHTRDSQGKTNG